MGRIEFTVSELRRRLLIRIDGKRYDFGSQYDVTEVLRWLYRAFDALGVSPRKRQYVLSRLFTPGEEAEVEEATRGLLVERLSGVCTKQKSWFHSWQREYALRRIGEMGEVMRCRRSDTASGR